MGNVKITSEPRANPGDVAFWANEHNPGELETLQAFANMKAVADELLEALEELTPHVGSNVDGNFNRRAKARKRALAAIAKARGETG